MEKTWKVQLSDAARRDLRKLDPPVQKEIQSFLRKKLTTPHDPRRLGHALQGFPFWTYRVRDYRLICDIQDRVVTIFVVTIGHRREVYR